MWVKICGNTNLEDAAQAAELGADAVGFVFAASRRKVTAPQVQAITAHLPPGLERVGVFDSQDDQEIAGVALDAGLTAVQLHGSFNQALMERLADRLAGRTCVIQTLHWTVGGVDGEKTAAARLAEQIRRAAQLGVDRVLVDSEVGGMAGGTGVAFDWAAAREVFQAAPDGVRLVVAGGLRHGNVAEAIVRLRPWGVDVCSGVEASPGRKDPELLARFIAAAHEAAAP